MKVHEVVELHDGHVHRKLYAYYLSDDGQEIGGLERDPRHDPAEHGHCSERVTHERFDAPAVSFKEAVERAWTWLAEH